MENQDLNLHTEKNDFFLEQAPTGFFRSKPDGSFIELNNSFAKLLGFKSSEEALKYAPNFFKLFSESEKANYIRNLLSKKSQIKAFQSSLNTLSGTIPVKINILTSTSESSESGIFFGLVEKFDEANHTSDLASNQINVYNAMESTGDYILSVDKSTKITSMNSAFKRFAKRYTGASVKPGISIVDIFRSPKEKNLWLNWLSTAYKGEHLATEFTFQSEKKQFSYGVSFFPSFSQQYDLRGVTIIFSDISDRKQAEEAIQESEVRFRELAENTNDAFILWNAEKVLYVNPAFEKIFKIPVEKVSDNYSITENSISEKDRKRFIKNRTQELKSGKTSKSPHYNLIKSIGKNKRIWARHFPVYNKAGEAYRNITVISDISDQIFLESSLNISKSQQQAILDNIPYLAWLKDFEGHYISINRPFAKFYHKSPEEIIGKKDQHILPKEISKISQKADKEVIDSKRRRFFEEEYTVNGEKVWIETYIAPILDQSGDLLGITGISRDITDRKKMEEVIVKNEEHFRSLLQYSSDAITILNKEGKITFESSLRNRILDFTMDELIGKNFEEIIHPDETTSFADTLSEILSKPGVQIKKEYRSLHKNKKWIYVESIFTNHLNNPSISGIVVNTRDISDRKMAELKERVYHDNLIFLSNSALDLLSIADRKDIYRYIAEKLNSFLTSSVIIVASYLEESDSFMVEEVSGLGKNHDKVIKMLDFDPVGMKYKRDSETSNIGSAGIISTYFGKLEDSSIDNIESSVSKPIIDFLKINKLYNITLARHNKLLGNISILTLNKSIIKFKHIIETFVHQVAVALHRSQLEYELVQAKLKAEESDRLKTAFLANMSHEIRTPMNGILGFAEMLDDDSITDENRKKYVEIINNNGKILIGLIDDIIDFAKIEAGQLKTIQHEFSLNTLLAQVHSSFLSESLKRERSLVKLRMRKAFTNTDNFIKTDPNRLRQVLTNLVGNAFKFTKEGFIEFGYKLKDKKTLLFYVQDTGIGIAQEKLDIIFERFVQADSSRSRKYSGSGLGLAISRGFVELLGGKMWAESTVGEGSTFYFTLPYVAGKEKPQEEKAKKKPKSTYNWKGKTFLVAEDDLFSYKFLEGFLKQTNADILHASDGGIAVDICKKNKDIDIILMDVQMPEMNGLDATKNIKGFRKELPIIAQTANAIAEERQKCFEAGFDDFVTKPINISELFMKIDNWLSKK